MPFYHGIDGKSEEGRRTASRLLEIQKLLHEQVTRSRNLEDTLLLATWNIREFDSASYGYRLEESFYYLAEIISSFDVVAVQEVRKDLKALDRLMGILGGFWKYIFTDVTEGTAGNRERMAFLYDSRKVKHGGLAGELVLPPVKIDGKLQPVSQLARTPCICGFRAGWSRFMLATVHVVYGESAPDSPARVEEIRQLAQFLRSRTLDRTAWSRNLILLGDFNIFSPQDKTMEALEGAGFMVPDSIKTLPSNVARNKHYDQIAFRNQDDRLQIAVDESGNQRAGVVSFFDVVFKDEEEAVYAPLMGEAYLKTKDGTPRSDESKSRYYKAWRTHQMSDHLPLWVELEIDYSARYLERKLAGEV